MADHPKAQLIHLETDRRLGHEWDEWDGTPLPNQGNFDSSPVWFFVWSAVAAVFALGVLRVVIFLLEPHLTAVEPGATSVLTVGFAIIAGTIGVWWVLLSLSFALGLPLLPERLAERGPFLRLMRLTSRIADRFGWRDRVENASVKVFNTLARLRKRKVGEGELLLLVPRCLSRETLEGVLSVAGKYTVPVFVATRGQMARRAIRERRPRAVVAVACERDMVSGLHDVAGRVPVLGLTMQLPSGPCKDAVVDLGQLEDWVRAYVA